MPIQGYDARLILWMVRQASEIISSEVTMIRESGMPLSMCVSGGAILLRLRVRVERYPMLDHIESSRRCARL